MFDKNNVYVGDEKTSEHNANFFHKNLNNFLVSKTEWENKIPGVSYVLNKENFRSNDFITMHNSKHIVFAGCSNTFGTGNRYEDVWSYLLYNKILTQETCSGYFNLGAEGATIFEIIVNLYRYIRKYSKPDLIFLLLPNIERDYVYFKNSKIWLNDFIVEYYKQIEDYCISNNITLISSSWLTPGHDHFKLTSKEGIIQASKGDPFFEFGIRDPFEALNSLEKNTSTFKNMKVSKLSKDIYDFTVKNKNINGLMETVDNSNHHGIAFHYAWSEYFYERYLNEKNNI
jgi:hypothetical protein